LQKSGLIKARRTLSHDHTHLLGRLVRVPISIPSRDVNRNGMKNPASEVETTVALEARPSALKWI